MYVTVQVPQAAARDAIEAILFRFVTVFALDEKTDERELEGLFWEQRPSKNGAYSLVLSREFSDPAYPERFESALREISGRSARETLTIH